MWSPRDLVALVAVCGALAAGCAGSARSAKEPKASDSKGSVDITKAALPFKVLARGGSEIPVEQLMSTLASSRAVCIGESHKNPHHHWVQLHLFDKLSEKGSTAGIMTALGMEMFQRPFQRVLDDFAAGKISLAEMLTRTGYQQRWGYDWGFYGPIVDLAIKRDLPLLALNTERELTKRVSRAGLTKLTDAERARLPELDLADPTHRAWWEQIMGSMGGAHGHSSGSATEEKQDPHGEDPHGEKPHGDKPEDPHGEDPHGENPHGEAEAKAPEPAEETVGDRIYAAQVLWDETMADGAAKWLAGGDKRQVVILAGNGHCHDSAIVGRLKRRGVAEVVSVRPILETGEGEVAEALAQPMNDYLLILQIPE
jgi:uncharacterized iron-regulated protein